MIPAATYYDERAAVLARRYQDLTFAQVHSPFVRHLPEIGGRVLDIGAGSGRDALALAELGYDVVGVEPSVAMRAEAEACDPNRLVGWVDDHLPDLMAVCSRRGSFDFILCSAVLMHVARGDLSSAFGTMTSLLVEGGRIAVTIRQKVRSDPPGLFHSHESDDILDAAGGAGLRLIDQGSDADQLGRSDVVWRWMVLERGVAD